VSSNTGCLSVFRWSDSVRLTPVVAVHAGGPCRKFTPDLVNFYKKINKRRKNDFEIVWVSRCRAVDAHWEFFAHMGWMSIPPEEAMGKRGPSLSDRFKVKGIPTLVLLDSEGHVITRDGRNKIPQDTAGIGFPWRNPIATLYLSLVPKSVRTLAKRQLSTVGRRLQAKLGESLGAVMRSKKSAAKSKVAAA
jgi:nucleoredoxin